MIYVRSGRKLDGVGGSPSSYCQLSHQVEPPEDQRELYCTQRGRITSRTVSNGRARKKETYGYVVTDEELPMWQDPAFDVHIHLVFRLYE